MSEIVYDFQLRRHIDGYELIELNGEERIRAKGVQLIPLGHPKRLLYAAFSNLRTPAEVLAFVQEYGPVATWPGPFASDSVSDCLELARFFRGLMSNRKKGPKRLASFFDSQMHEKFWSWIEPAGSIDVVADPQKGLRLKIGANNLIGVLWWQLVENLTSGNTKIRVCSLPRCEKVFRVGSATRRHGNREFCCDEHRVEFHSHKRTGDAGFKMCLWPECGKEFPVGRGGKRSDAKFCCDEHRKLFNNRKHSMKG